MLQIDPQGQRWALECQPKAGQRLDTAGWRCGTPSDRTAGAVPVNPIRPRHLFEPLTYLLGVPLCASVILHFQKGCEKITEEVGVLSKVLSWRSPA